MYREDNETSGSHNENYTPNVSTEKEFQSFVNMLSIHYGESSEPWLGLFSDSTGDFVESTLQRLGILSFSVSGSREESKIVLSTKDNRSIPQNYGRLRSLHSLSTKNWPFPLELGMRKAMGRIERSVLSLENGSDPLITLLMCPATDHKEPNRKPKESKRLKARESSTPMMIYLYDSGILYTVFSFCGPKQLATIPQVCKTWKATVDSVSNNLWEKAYVAQFDKYKWPCLDSKHRYLVAISAITAVVHKNYSCTAKHVDKSYWKDLFIQKHIAEKLVRFQRNPRSGFKHRTCNYLGCLQILKSADQERKHDQMHLRLLAKRQAASKKKKLQKRG